MHNDMKKIIYTDDQTCFEKHKTQGFGSVIFFDKGKSTSWSSDATVDRKLGHDKYADYPVSIDSLSLITVISVDWSGCFYIGMTC